MPPAPVPLPDPQQSQTSLQTQHQHQHQLHIHNHSDNENNNQNSNHIDYSNYGNYGNHGNHSSQLPSGYYGHPSLSLYYNNSLGQAQYLHPNGFPGPAVYGSLYDQSKSYYQQHPQHQPLYEQEVLQPWQVRPPLVATAASSQPQPQPQLQPQQPQPRPTSPTTSKNISLDRPAINTLITPSDGPTNRRSSAPLLNPELAQLANAIVQAASSTAPTPSSSSSPPSSSGGSQAACKSTMPAKDQQQLSHQSHESHQSQQSHQQQQEQQEQQEQNEQNEQQDQEQMPPSLQQTTSTTMTTRSSSSASSQSASQSASQTQLQQQSQCQSDTLPVRTASEGQQRPDAHAASGHSDEPVSHKRTRSHLQLSATDTNSNSSSNGNNFNGDEDETAYHASHSHHTNAQHNSVNSSTTDGGDKDGSRTEDGTGTAGAMITSRITKSESAGDTNAMDTSDSRHRHQQQQQQHQHHHQMMLKGGSSSSSSRSSSSLGMRADDPHSTSSAAGAVAAAGIGLDHRVRRIAGKGDGGHIIPTDLCTSTSISSTAGSSSSSNSNSLAAHGPMDVDVLQSLQSLPLGLAAPYEPMPNYELIIRQQPSRARMSGFGIKDRRPLDPTPIAQVIMRNPDGSYGRARYDDAAFLISHVTLWSTDMSTQLSAVSAPAPTSFGPPIIGRSPAPDVPPTSQHNQILLGALISPCHILSDVDGDRGLFFIFPDVSVRTSGTYRIKISLYDIKGAISKKSPISFVVSDAFTVYSPKTFPGMSDSTPLSRTFSKQGIRIHIRTDAPKRDDQDSP